MTTAFAVPSLGSDEAACDERQTQSDPDVWRRRAQHLERRLCLVLLDLNVDSEIRAGAARPENDGGLTRLSHRQADL
jgi:hypothetical protein